LPPDFPRSGCPIGLLTARPDATVYLTRWIVSGLGETTCEVNALERVDDAGSECSTLGRMTPGIELCLGKFIRISEGRRKPPHRVLIPVNDGRRFCPDDDRLCASTICNLLL